MFRAIGTEGTGAEGGEIIEIGPRERRRFEDLEKGILRDPSCKRFGQFISSLPIVAWRVRVALG